MKKSKSKILIAALSVLVSFATPAYADSSRVVTLGADLSESQKNAMIKYFGANTKKDKVIYVNNQQERARLASYIPLEQIGNRTYSCAYVMPTTEGGIRVKTANLNYVSSNMIASALSTSGVTNCQVIAASPFPVSGTGALTGAIMAYESASGKPLDSTKTNLANKELVMTGKLANDIGQSTAIAIINESKMTVVEKKTTDKKEISDIVNSVTNEYNTTISQEQKDEVSALLEEISKQQYDIEQMKKTLEQVQANVIEDTPASKKKIDTVITKAEKEKGEQAAQPVPDSGITSPENSDISPADLNSGSSTKIAGILENTDDSALKEINNNQPVIENTTEETVVKQKAETETQKTENASPAIDKSQDVTVAEMVPVVQETEKQTAETEVQAKNEASTEKAAGIEKAAATEKNATENMPNQQGTEKKETVLYGKIIKIDKEKVELNTASVIWKKGDAETAEKTDQKALKADFKTDTMKWKLDGKTVVVQFDKDTKFLKQVSTADSKKDTAGQNETAVVTMNQMTETAPEKTTADKKDVSKEITSVESEIIKLEDMKEGVVVSVKIKEGGNLVAAEVLILANVTAA